MVRGGREKLGGDRELLCGVEFEAGMVPGISVRVWKGVHFV